MDSIDKKILNLIQEGIPFDRRPFMIMGSNLGIEESEIINRIQKLKEEGYIRRFGGIFNSKGLGYTSTLCALKVPKDRIDEVAKIINSYHEVTHNYIREDVFNIWFTIIAPSQEQLEKLIDEIKCNTNINEMINLPASKVFKVKVKLNMGE